MCCCPGVAHLWWHNRLHRDEVSRQISSRARYRDSLRKSGSAYVWNSHGDKRAVDGKRTTIPCGNSRRNIHPIALCTQKEIPPATTNSDGWLSCPGWWLFAKTSVNSTGAIAENSRSFYPSFPRDLLLSSPFFKLVKGVSQPLLVKGGGGGGPSGPLVWFHIYETA